MFGRITSTQCLAGLALCLAVGAHLGAQQARDAALPVPDANNHVEYMVPMRDGVELATSVYIPEGDGPWPVIVERTPYSKAGGAPKGQRLTAHGYIYAHQDSRGRFRSEGVYEPYQTDIADGYDTIEWAAAQPWSNGKVGVTGRSAMGIHANLAAAGAPPRCSTSHISMGGSFASTSAAISCGSKGRKTRSRS
jgi:predicted acyl esterase